MKLRHVAVVDDAIEFQHLVQAMLEYLGISKVELWTNSKEALPELVAVPPQLLILDVMMAGLDGISVWRNLRNERRTARMPIIVCTAAINSILDKETVLHDDPFTFLLVKPFTLEDLQSAINTLLPEWETLHQ